MDYEQWDPSRYGEGHRDYNGAGRKQRKKNTGLLAVLVVLAVLTAAASWAVNFLDIRAGVSREGVVITMGGKELNAGDESAEEEADQSLSEQTEERELSQMESHGQETEGQTVLLQQQSPAGMENVPSSAEDALSLQAIYEKVIPSVASIICEGRGGSATGTGIVMSDDGYVITNFHVIDGAEQIQVLLYDEKLYSAEVIGGDEPTDLAVLKIQASGLKAAEFGNSDGLRVGDLVVAIGDPLGTELRGTMTDGIISAINRDLKIDGRYMTLVQTNAALNSGNSGGPLINCYGQVIGINTMKMSSYTSAATVEGLGFAIPVNTAKPIIDELIGNGYIAGRPAIGIEGATLDVRTQFFYNLPSGVGVTSVEEGSDAAAKGLMPDDVIVSFNGNRVSTMEGLSAAKEGFTAGDTVKLVIYRDGRYYEVSVVLMDQTRPELQ